MQNTDQVHEESLQTVEVEHSYPIETEEETTNRRNWLMLAALALACLALLVLLFLGGRWVYRELHHSSKLKPTPVVSSNPTGRAPINGKSSSASSSNSSNTTAQATTGQIPNTGPGNVVALFVASSFAAASLHYILTLRKQS